jgi:hypothetical protein
VKVQRGIGDPNSSEVIRRWLRKDDRVQIAYKGRLMSCRVVETRPAEALLEWRIGNIIFIRAFPYRKIRRLLPRRDGDG